MTFGAILFTIAAIAAQVGDLLTTEKGIELGAKEANPVAKWLNAKFGQWGFYGLKILAALALLWAWFTLSVEVYCIVAFALFATGAYAVVSNTRVINKLRARK